MENRDGIAVPRLTFAKRAGEPQELSTPSEGVVSARPTFRDVYDQHFTYVWNCVRRLGISSQDLEDVVQEVFEDVFQKLPTFDPDRSIRPWLFGVALRTVLNHRRWFRRRREVLRDWGSSSGSEPVDHSPQPDRHAELAQNSHLVEMALESLELNRRAVFVMSEIAGHTMPEIADALAVPLNTAYSRLRLARRDFEAAVRRLQRKERAP
jgi:RNA polymerase sigma-70 factor (ECF subfamily)